VVSGKTQKENWNGTIKQREMVSPNEGSEDEGDDSATTFKGIKRKKEKQINMHVIPTCTLTSKYPSPFSCHPSVPFVHQQVANHCAVHHHCR
jgi:hypothetical protein